MRTQLTFTALALALVAGVALPDDARTPHTPILKNRPLPKLRLLDEDGERHELTEQVEANRATVIVFFDPAKGPTFLNEPQSTVPGIATEITQLHARFKERDVTWAFVAQGETAAVDSARAALRSARDPERKQTLADAVEDAREAQFAGFRKALEDSGIEDYALYTTSQRLQPGPTEPLCAIVRGELNVAHVARASDRRAVDTLAIELSLAIGDPSGSGGRTLPASAPKPRR